MTLCIHESDSNRRRLHLSKISDTMSDDLSIRLLDFAQVLGELSEIIMYLLLRGNSAYAGLEPVKLHWHRPWLSKRVEARQEQLERHSALKKASHKSLQLRRLIGTQIHEAPPKHMHV